jgi:hypothetical protein
LAIAKDSIRISQIKNFEGALSFHVLNR